MTGAVAVDLDGALGDTHGLWEAFLADAARRFRPIAELDVPALPTDRGAAAAELDRWAAGGVGDWRSALERFAEDHAPVYVRPSARAIECPRLVLPTPGGPTRQRIGAFAPGFSLRTARCSMMRSFTSRMP